MGSKGRTTHVPARAGEGGPTELARQLEAVLASIAEGVNIVDADGRVVLVNEGFVRLYRFPPELAVAGTPLAAFVRHRLAGEHADLAEADVEALVAKRVKELLSAEPGQVEESLPDGRVVQIRRQRLPDGLLVSTYSDVTEQKRHEERLALLAMAVEQEGDSVEIADAEYRLQFVNPAFTTLTGYRREEALGRTPAELVRSDQHDAAFFARVHETLQRGEVWQGRLVSRHKDGRLIHQDATISPVRDQAGCVTHYVAVKRDVGEQVRAAEALRASEERFRSIIEDQTEFISRFGPDCTVTFINQAYARHLGRPPESIVGSSILGLMTAAQQEVFRSQLARLTPERPTASYEMETTLPTGEVGWEEWTDRALFDASGRVVEYQSVGRDVTEQRRSAHELRESEERLRTIAEGVPVPLAISRTDTSEMLFANERAIQIYGKPAGSSRGEILSAWVNPQERLDLAAEVQRRGRVDAREARLRKADGTPFWALVSARTITYAGHAAILTTSIDISDQKRMEQALRASEAHFRAIVEDQTEFISRLDTDLNFTFANGALCQHHGKTPRQLIGTSVLQMMSGEQQERFLASIGQLSPDKPTVSGEHRIVAPDGRTIWEQWTDRALFDRTGEIVGYQAVGRDITQQKLAEHALLETEVQLRAIAEGVPLPIVITALPEPENLFVNQWATEIFGIQAGDRGEAILELWEQPDRRREMVRHLSQDGRVDGFEAQLRRADGSSMFALISARQIVFGGRDAMLIAAVDITERRRMEQELKAGEERFRTIAEAHPVPMIIARLSDRVAMFVNAAFRELFRLDPAEPATVDITRLYARPSERGDAFHLVMEQGRIDGLELTMLRTDGAEVPVSLTSRIIDYQGDPAAVTSFTDLSDKRRAEAEIARQREALHQTEKISALGTLLAGVAHELNNPLSVVVGQSALLEETASDDATARRAGKIRGAADRCARIVRTFLTMARSRPLARGPVDVNATIEAALELLAYGLRTADVGVSRDLSSDLPAVWGEADQLHQVFTNLIINAQHAMQEIEPPRELRVSTRREGEMARIEVTDNGPGMDAQVASRAFEPFFTTKPSGVGTGIGLSVCHGIVRGHEGTIELSSAPGEGVSFVVRLPLASHHRGSSADELEGRERLLRACVLVVDDEPEVAELVADVLRHGGHQVSIAASGREALDRIGRERLDLIVSDLRMPNLDGPSLHRALAEISPDLATRLIFVTGDALSHQAERFLAESGAEVLEKPVDPRQLIARVQAKLASGRVASGFEPVRSDRDGGDV